MDDIVDINTLFGPMPSAASDLGVDELSTMMERHGVRACCTLSTVGLLLDHHAGNSATRAACTEDDRLIPVATVNPVAFFGGDGPHTRFKADGFRMVRLFPAAQDWPPDFAPFRALLETLQAESLPLMIEVNQPGDATAIARMLEDHPSPLVFSGVDERSLAEALCLMRTNPGLYVETSALVSTGAVKAAVDAAGPDRVLFGSGAPARPMASGLSVIRYAGLADSQRVRVLGGNARMLLGI